MIRFGTPHFWWEVYHPAHGALLLMAGSREEAAREAARRWGRDLADPAFVRGLSLGIGQRNDNAGHLREN